jgi:hypothetical protein
MTLLSDERQVARQLRRTRPAKPARFRRDRSRDYPVGYLAQLARPLLARKGGKASQPRAARMPERFSPT